MLDRVREYLEIQGVLPAIILFGSIIAAYVTQFVLRHTFMALAKRTETELDDKIGEALKGPIFTSVVLIGGAWALYELDPSPRTLHVCIAILKTIAVVIWTIASFRVGHLLFQSLGRRAKPNSLIKPRTVPIFDIFLKVVVVILAVYFIFVAWNINVTAWLASAGILGIVIGLAAQDSLANLFAGFFILADAPYKVGDWVVVEQGLRGKVTRIGMRSTRILTRDDIEITIPNSVMGNSKIINEAGGPHQKQRVPVAVSCAYGSDIDEVRRVLLDCVPNTPGVCADAPAQVMFRSFGDSGLNFELLVWVDNPADRGPVLDVLNSRAYKAFAANGIEIPFPKRDVYIRESAR